MAFPLNNPQSQFFDLNGAPLSSGTIEFRDPTSNNLIDTYPTADDADAQTNANANPLTLNARGEAATGIYLEDGVKYKIILKTALGATVWTQDDVRVPLYSASSIGKQLHARTAAETSAGITPTNYQYEPGDLIRYGAAVDGTTDDSAAWNALADVIASGEVVTSSKSGTSKCTSQVIFDKSVVFDMPNVTVDMDGADFVIRGSQSSVTATLSSAASKGDMSLSVTDSGDFAVGDLFIIHDTADNSFSAHRAAYQKGEFIEITSISAGSVSISDALRDDYSATANLTFFRVTPIKVVNRGLSFSGSGDFAIVSVDLCRDVEFTNVVAKGGTDRAVEFRRCYGVRVNGGSYEHREADTLGTHYGISIANCQNVVATPRLAFGTRHGVSIGGYNSDGAIVNRDVFIRNATVSNDDSIYSADIHGNAENCWYENCVITNRAGIGGKNCGVRGGSIDGADNDLRVMSWTEIVGGDIVFDDVRVTVRGLNTAFGYASSTIMADVEQNFRNVLRNIVIDYKGSRANPGIFGNFADGTKVTEWSIEMRGIKYIDDSAVLDRVASCNVENPSAFATSPVNAAKLVIDDIEVPDPSSLTFWISTSNSADFSSTEKTFPTVEAFITFTASDGTPSVVIGKNFLTDTGTLTITDFDDGVEGKEIAVISKGAVTFDTTGTNLTGSSVDLVTASGDVTRWICEDGTTWRLIAFVDASVDNSAGA